MTLQHHHRRLSACHRHPSADSTSAFCPSCLHERLSLIVSPSRSPDLRRCKSYKHRSPRIEPGIRRKSCDVRPRSSLSGLFQADDQAVTIESRALGFSGVDKLGESEVAQRAEDGEEEDGKTMKAHIDLEFELRIKRSSGLWGGAASVFSQKLQKWRLKQHNKKEKRDSGRLSASHAPEPKGLTIGRRSCYMEPRLSVDAGRNSMEDPPRFSLDEPRASWDGYMVARTIPRLAPMLSVIENAMIAEDETNSVSESSSSQRRNSFDCSSSGKSSSKHRVPGEIELRKESPLAKIVFSGTDKATLNFNLYDDPSKRSESASKNVDSIKKKVLKILGFRSKSTDARHWEVEGDCCEKQIGEGNGVANVVSSEKIVGRKSYSYHRSPTGAEIRGPATTFERSRSVRYSPSPSNFENGLLRFHLAPPLSRRKKSERRGAMNSQSNARSVLRLN